MDPVNAELAKAIGVPGFIFLVMVGLYRKQIWDGLSGSNSNKGMEALFAKNLEHFEKVTVGTGHIIKTLEASERHLEDILGVQRKLHEEVIRQGVKK